MDGDSGNRLAVWSFLPRLCKCKYGMLAAMGLMITEQDRAAARAVAYTVVAWYHEALRPLLSLVPRATVVTRFAYPGGTAEALRQLGG